MYVARQVVTNSKGEKVEVYWNSQVFEDLSLLCVGFAPVMEYIDYHWEIFLWGDPPIHPLCDFDLVRYKANSVRPRHLVRVRMRVGW